MMQYQQLLIRSRRGSNNWCGKKLTKVWTPAITGRLNETNEDDETASTFEAGAPAMGAHLFLVHELRRIAHTHPWNAYDGDLELMLKPCKKPREPACNPKDGARTKIK